MQVCSLFPAKPAQAATVTRPKVQTEPDDSATHYKLSYKTPGLSTLCDGPRPIERLQHSDHSRPERNNHINNIS
jgi:hypothetical protein